MRLFWLLVLSSASHSTGYDCETMPLTMELVGLLAKRTSLMGEVAAQKADFALVFDAAQELAVLKAAAAAVQSTAIPSAVAMVFAQLMADCAKQEQEAHIRAAVEAAEAAGEVRHGKHVTMESSYDSLEQVREVLSDLNNRMLERWQLASQPDGEWDQQGCECTLTTLAELFMSTFRPAAVGGCGSPMFSEMLTWTLVSAGATCRMPAQYSVK